MRVAFAGTPEFARVALARIVAAGFEVPLVLTQPDRPAGRGMKLVASPVKAFALERGIAVAQPPGLRLDGRHADDARAAQRSIAAAAPDVIVVAAYGLLLPPWLLELPRHGCVNIHASLLPRWRGAAPIQRAILAGDETSGVTLMLMDEGLDTGPMLARHTLDIRHSNAGQVTEDMANLGARMLVDWLDSPTPPEPQPIAGA
nr:methionyl-tRNA formyltransferase [Caldimonas sp.]